MTIYSRLDFLIATRLHSAIFALAVETPIVAIAYDEGGKWGILDRLGCGNLVVAYSGVNSSMLIQKILGCWANRVEILHEVRKNVVDQIRDVDLNAKLILEFWDKRIV